VALELLPAEQHEITEAAAELRLCLDFIRVELLILWALILNIKSP